MKTIKKISQLEHGQVLPIIVVGLIVLIMMAALILDGGALLTNRRRAQNAADAAALAGARVFCKQEDYQIEDVNAAIELYATDNGATVIWDETGLSYENLNTIEGLAKGEVVATTQVSHGSFFARIFNEDMLTAKATAAAGCFPYGASVVLPIAFPCYTPDLQFDSEDLVVSEECDYVMLDWEYFESIATGCGMADNPLLEGFSPTTGQAECMSKALFAAYKEYIYVVVESDKFCAQDPENVNPNNELICKLTGGRTQLNSAARGWLNLAAGNAGTNTLNDWIRGINNPSVRVHNWMSFLGGERGQPIYSTIADRLYDIVWIPVFNDTCTYKPDASNPYSDPCMVSAHTEFADPGSTCQVIDGSPGQVWGHVIAYAPFFTTCVKLGENDDSCPGFNLAAQVNETALDKTKYALEGYFIQPWWLDNPEIISVGGADLKIYTVSLTR